VFDDIFGVSETVHVLVIPTRPLVDITSLTSEDLPLVLGMNFFSPWRYFFSLS
jgi:hypothetical protein